MVHGSTDWTDFLRIGGHDIDLSAADNWPRFASVLLHMTCGCSTRLTSNNKNKNRNMNNNNISNNNMNNNSYNSNNPNNNTDDFADPPQHPLFERSRLVFGDFVTFSVWV